MLNTNKPKEYTADQIAEFERNNPSRGKVKLVRFASEATPGQPAQFWIVRPSPTQLNVIADAKGAERATAAILNYYVLAGDLDQLADDVEMKLGLLEACSNLVTAKQPL